MKTHTDQEIREIMENASVSEFLPGFDEAQTWKEIQRRIQKPASVWYKKVLPYAAVLIMGVLISQIFGKLYEQKAGTVMSLSAVRNIDRNIPMTANTVAEMKDTVVTKLASAKRLKKPGKTILSESPKAIVRAALVPETQIPLTQEPDLPKEQTRSVELLVATPQLQVKHYYDVLEPADVPAANTYVHIPRKRIIRLTNKRKEQDYVVKNPEQFPLRNFFYAIDK